MEADVLATSSHLVCFNIAESNKGNAEKQSDAGGRQISSWLLLKEEDNLPRAFLNVTSANQFQYSKVLPRKPTGYGPKPRSNDKFVELSRNFPQTFFTFKLKLSCIHDEENVLHVNSTTSITYWKAFSDFPRRSRANLERNSVTEVRGK